MAKWLTVVPYTENQKLGRFVSCTYRPVGRSCPWCDLWDVCYAKRGHVARVQIASAAASDSLSAIDGAHLVRHHVSGDFFAEDSIGRKRVDVPYVREVIAWHKAPKQRRTIGWTYSHGVEQLAAAGFGPRSWPKGLTVLASTEDLDKSTRLQSQGWRTARVAWKIGDRQANEVYCPYDLARNRRQKHKTTCADCRLCWESKRNIVFIKG